MRSRLVAGETIPTPRGDSNASLKTWAEALATILTRRFATADASTNTSLDSKAGLAQMASGHWLIEVPDDKSYTVIQKAAFAFSITEVTTIATAGTCTVTIEINGTPLGGTANSASVSEQSQAHASANDVAAGDTVEIVVSSNSGCEGLTVDIAGTMQLAA
jgi:hypothetical protein